jgi:hypothetical protein
VREILFENTVIQAIAAGRQIGRDFWIVDVAHFTRPVYGTWESAVAMVFAEPVSYQGELPTASEPCEGHYGPDEQVDEDDPCLDEPREYGTEFASLSGRVIHAWVDVIRGEVVYFFAPDDTPPDVLEDMIDDARQEQIWISTPTAVPP